METKPDFELIYFDSKGVTEPMRYMLTYAGVPFTDTRIPFDVNKYPPVVPPEIKAKSPYGQVPLLIYKGQPLAQGKAIARFVARKVNLQGDDDFEAAKCDEIVDALKDIGGFWWPAYLEKDEVKLAEIKRVATEKSQMYLKKFQEMLEANGGKYIVGKRLSWADIMVAHYMDLFHSVHNVTLVTGYPLLQNLMDHVFSLPGIKEWIAKRPYTKY